MSSDRELLELSAKAAGINYHHIDEDGVWWRKHPMADSVFCWSPLTDDGDALRLAVKLHIDLEWQDDASIEAYQRNDTSHYCAAEDGHDMASATRRAIVRAAAEIGRGIP